MPAVTSRKTYDCTICAAQLNTQRDLDNHMCLVHDECGEARLGTPITFRCATCGEAFSRRGDLLAHMEKNGHGHVGGDKIRGQGGRRPRGRPRRSD